MDLNAGAGQASSEQGPAILARVWTVSKENVVFSRALTGGIFRTLIGAFLIVFRRNRGRAAEKLIFGRVLAFRGFGEAFRGSFLSEI